MAIDFGPAYPRAVTPNYERPRWIQFGGFGRKLNDPRTYSPIPSAHYSDEHN